jgi:uncharacterized protein
MFARNINLPTTKSFFLFGPRGVGKSTLVRKRYPKSVYIDLLDSRTYQRLLADPGALVEYIPQQWHDFIIIDEVQKVPQLLDEVHRLIENSGFKFILTGSSARKLRREGVNLLAGRALNYRLFPLTAEELGSDFELAKAINYGTLPEVINLTDEEIRARYLLSYVDNYLKEEVAAEGLTRNLSAFARFLQVASFSVGQVVNMAEIAREVGIERKVVQSYFEILDDLMLGVRVPIFSNRAKRELVVKPKFYYFDTGIYQTLRPRSVLDTDREIGGAALENLFLQHLLAATANEVQKYEVCYWRTVSGREVDFVLHGGNRLLAFEIKSNPRFSKSWLKGLKEFGRDYKEAELFLLYTGREKLYFDKIQVLPITEYLSKLSQNINSAAQSTN